MALSFLGKMFFGNIVSWITKDSKMGFKLRGSPEKVNALTKAIVASKDFLITLRKEDASMEEIIEKLNIKNAAVEEAERILGCKIPFT